MNTKAIKGRQGEEYAAEYLRSKGFAILEMNFSFRQGEIDIIAQNDAYIVFTEVKTRSSSPLVSGVEAVNPAKRRRIVLASMHYLASHVSKLQPRFDVIEVNIRRGEAFVPLGLNHIENAFGAEIENASF
ncbi:MAG: YraN family protein [Oscillospiraceae bacterium]|jgi:putative endonuclease|nr:YraN family protein [Oscillospiraceae bacterium]